MQFIRTIEGFHHYRSISRQFLFFSHLIITFLNSQTSPLPQNLHSLGIVSVARFFNRMDVAQVFMLGSPKRLALTNGECGGCQLFAAVVTYFSTGVVQSLSLQSRGPLLPSNTLSLSCAAEKLNVLSLPSCLCVSCKTSDLCLACLGFNSATIRIHMANATLSGKW